ncbi:DMT family transporter [Aeromicrobium sp. CF4.19]|uniref:EamA family transporter n=1 Tax=Aeromicrobium sp. CF4.19 TaxID=3373082 RepID=UPI003EE4B3F1
MAAVESQHSNRSPVIGYVLALTAAVLFGINAGMTRVPLRSGTDVTTFTSVRITGAMVLVVLIALVVDRTALRPPSWREVPLVVGLGVVGIVGLQGLYNVAIDRLPLGIALLLEYTGPVLVVLWVRFGRREPVHRRVWPALLLTLVGLAVVGQVWSGLAFDGLGVVMALGAAVCLAAYFLLGEDGRVSAEPLRYFVWALVAAAVLMTVVRPAWTATELGVQASMLGRLDAFSVPAWSAMTATIVLGTVAPFFLLLLALRALPAVVVSVVAMLEPVVATIVGWAWFSESLSPLQVGGVLAVLAGIVLAQTARRRVIDPALPPTT